MLIVWTIIVVLLALATYCFLSAYFPNLPMVAWGTDANGPSIPMSRRSRINLGRAILLFALLAFAGQYKPAMFHRVLLEYLAAVIILLAMSFRDWRAEKRK